MKKTTALLTIAALASLAGVASAQVPVYRTVTYTTTTPVVIQNAPTVPNAPIFGAQPVYVQTAPVIVYQQPVCVAPAPVYVAAPPVYYAPPVVSLGFGFGGRHHGFSAYVGPSFGFGFNFGHARHSRHCR